MGVGSQADLGIHITESNASDELRSLWEWLSREDSLRGRVRLTGPPPKPGSMGAASESLLVALGPSGVAASVASVLIAWLRTRTSAITVAISHPDGRVIRLDAKNVRGLSPEKIRELTDGITIASGTTAQ